jgi:MFS superfamily sulfate permease-like transporter
MALKSAMKNKGDTERDLKRMKAQLVIMAWFSMIVNTILGSLSVLPGTIGDAFYRTFLGSNVLVAFAGSSTVVRFVNKVLAALGESKDSASSKAAVEKFAAFKKKTISAAVFVSIFCILLIAWDFLRTYSAYFIFILLLVMQFVCVNTAKLLAAESHHKKGAEDPATSASTQKDSASSAVEASSKAAPSLRAESLKSSGPAKVAPSPQRH